MAVLTGPEGFDKLSLIIDLGELSLIRTALSVFETTPVENLAPEQMLMAAIFDGNAERVEAGKLLISLHKQEEEMPIFQQAQQEFGAEIAKQ